MKRFKAVMFWLALAGMVNADVWVIAPDGYYLLQLDASGAPITTPAIGITGHQFMGQPDPIDPPDPPGPTEDKWGLVALSQTEAMKVNDPNDPKNATGGQVGKAYREIGKLVQAGTIPKESLKQALQMAFDAAVGREGKEFWQPWKDETDEGYNAVDFQGATGAGQGVIDIGTGASLSSNAALSEFWVRIFMEFILPWILDKLNLDPAVALTQSQGVQS